MLLVETAIFYLLLGAAVAAAVYIRGTSVSGIRGSFDLVAACLFWPLFVPMLLTPASPAKTDISRAADSNPDARDALSAAIAQVEAELDAALNGLDGWAEDVLNSEQHRLEELRAAWKFQAERIRQLDGLLAAPA